MTEEHFQLVLQAAEAKKSTTGHELPEGHLLTFHVASHGASLTVSRVQTVSLAAGLLRARTARGELFLLPLVDVFAAAVEASSKESRRAGFG